MFFSLSFLPLHFLRSDLPCYLSEQLVGLLPDIWAHPPPHTARRLSFLRLPQMRPLPCSETFGASLFSRKWNRKAQGPGSFHRPICHGSFIRHSFLVRGLHASDTSLLFSPVAFPLRTEWHQTGLGLPHVLLLCLPKRLPSSPRHLELLSPLTPQRLCTSHPQLIPILVVIYSFTLSNFSLPETITLRL